MIDRRAFLKSMASLTTGILLSSACAEVVKKGLQVTAWVPSCRHGSLDAPERL